MIDSTEKAYEAIAAYLQAFVGSRRWDHAICELRIYSRMATGSQWLVAADETDHVGGFESNADAMWRGLDAAVFLRDDLLKTTGARIWGLTFTLFPDGKFKIEYDYNKPDGYQESAETVDLSQAIENLQNQGLKVEKE